MEPLNHDRYAVVDGVVGGVVDGDGDGCVGIHCSYTVSFTVDISKQLIHRPLVDVPFFPLWL